MKPQIHIDTDPKLIRELIKENRWVHIKNKNLIPCKELVDFYKSIGTCHTQSKSFAPDEYINEFSDGYRELIPVRNKDISGYGDFDLFSGEDDGELLWHNDTSIYDADEDVVAFCIRKLGTSGGELSLCDTQKAYEDMNTTALDDIEVEYPERDWEWHNKWNFKNYIDSDGNPRYLKEHKYKPLVTINPLNDKKGFFYLFLLALNYKHYEYNEFQEIHQKIVNSLMSNVWVHKFELGDIIIQEQYHTLHRRAPYSGDRLLYRTSIWF